jgi:iron complex transport system permease protein
MRPAAVLTLLLLLSPLACLAGLILGSTNLPTSEVLKALISPHAGIVDQIVWELRWPRVAAAFACGGLLSLAGVLLQVLVRNPLAEPYILGISGGAALGALSALLGGAGLAGMHSAAVLGALMAIAAVFLLSGGVAWNMFRLLLTGVVLSAGFGAAVSLLLALAPAADSRGMLFWLLGDMGYVTHPAWAWAVLSVVLLFALCRARALDVMAAGALQAKALGVAVAPLQIGLYLAASLATAAAVAQSGPIGFIGLIVPHALRLLGLTSHRFLVPAAVLAGGTFLVLADLAARAVVAPQQLPVGTFTALIGVPTLLWLLSRKP